jgi:uncharacterized protein (DUF1810 family)
MTGPFNEGDPYSLERFVRAQNPVLEQVRSELRSGRKTGHWMWFVFPQISGLGSSAMAEEFAISSREEALAYLEHPILGARLRECTGIVLSLKNVSMDAVFGYPDCLKFRSCMTLFACVTPASDIFQGALRKYYKGEPDRLTLERV